MRFGVHLGPFWVSFGGRRKRKRARRPRPHPRRAAGPGAAKTRATGRSLARQRRITVMTPEEYGRDLGMSDDRIARALFTLTTQDRQQADAELQRLRQEMGYRDQD